MCIIFGVNMLQLLTMQVWSLTGSPSLHHISIVVGYLMFSIFTQIENEEPSKIIPIYLSFKGTVHPKIKKYFLLPVVLLINLDSFGVSCLVLGISAVEISVFSLYFLTYWNYFLTYIKHLTTRSVHYFL